MVSLNTIGMAGISMMIPVLAAYIAYSMAGKPALAPVLSWATWSTTPSSPRAATAFRPASWAP
ncbi:MAG: hypothetical protein ACLU37_11090 [Collinsella sp.]